MTARRWVCRGPRGAALLLGLTVTTSCAGLPDIGTAGPRIGLVDQDPRLNPERLACAVRRAPSIIGAAVAGRAGAVRRDAQVGVAQMRAHARSVQATMAEGDRVASGDRVEPTSNVGYGPRLLTPGAAAEPVARLSGKEARFLDGYARLRADVAAGRRTLSEDEVEDITGDEASHPRASAVYHQVVIALYGDPSVHCYPGG